jgi:hypothetical protein
LPEARRTESFTEPKLRTSANTIQLAPVALQASTTKLNAIVNFAGAGTGALPPENSLTPTTAIHASASAAENSPGTARFHGNAIGGGAAASRRTASITETTNPDEGTIFALPTKSDEAPLLSSSLFLQQFPPHSLREFAAQHLPSPG